jgi:hypothetical protein
VNHAANVPGVVAGPGDAGGGQGGDGSGTSGNLGPDPDDSLRRRNLFDGGDGDGNNPMPPVNPSAVPPAWDDALAAAHAAWPVEARGHEDEAVPVVVPLEPDSRPVEFREGIVGGSPCPEADRGAALSEAATAAVFASAALYPWWLTDADEEIGSDRHAGEPGASAPVGS